MWLQKSASIHPTTSLSTKSQGTFNFQATRFHFRSDPPPEVLIALGGPADGFTSDRRLGAEVKVVVEKDFKEVRVTLPFCGVPAPTKAVPAAASEP